MSADVLQGEAARDHHDLHVVQQLLDLLGRAVVGLVLGRHPDLGGLLDDLLADRVHAAVELADGAGPLGPLGGDPGQLAEQVIEGDGETAKPGATVDVHYLGVDFETLEEFDSSWSRGQSINFPLGSLIAGWQQGIPGMKVGGRRQLVVPPELAYGPAGGGHRLSGRTLIFVIDLQGVG